MMKTFRTSFRIVVISRIPPFWARRFRSLTIVDIYTRKSLAIEIGQSLRGEDVVRVLNRLKEQRGLPKMLFCDNGSESTG